MRWSSYVLASGDAVSDLWAEFLKDPTRRVLFILGGGFDPRMLSGLRVFEQLGMLETITAWLLAFDEGQSSPSLRHKADADLNLQQLGAMIPPDRLTTIGPVELLDAHRRRIGGRRAAELIAKQPLPPGVTDLVLDISALPRSLYFPVVAVLLNRVGRWPCQGDAVFPNLHILVAENPGIDMSIEERDVDESADFIQGFRGRFDRQSAELEHLPRVWLPLLGERQRTQLERIQERIRPGPDEIAPVLPSPALNPRRGDELILEYHDLLFERWAVEPRGIVYADERNPFEVYRQLVRTIARYGDALAPLGGCSVVLSALSSKLMSVGALLAAYELGTRCSGGSGTGVDVSVAHVESAGYERDDNREAERMRETEVFDLWLSGECYAR